MQSKTTHILRWAGAGTMLLLIGMLMIEGTWAVRLYHRWPFVATVLVACVLLGWAGVLDLRRRAWSASMSHLGLLLVLMGGMLGAVVETDVQMVVDSHASERVAYAANGQTVVMPFSLQLDSFRIDYYADSTSPKQYTSRLKVRVMDNGQQTTEHWETSVNHPAKYKGWWIYQKDYDHAQGDFVILQLVRDPWLPVVYLGFALMALGAIVQTRKAWHSWKVVPVALVLTGLFTLASLARIELGTLVPALRSLWFFPHILIYMIAYSLMAIALIVALLSLSPKVSNRWPIVGRSTVHKLMTLTSSLLLIGMLCGAIWAKDAWGQYWTWDGKECWAAVTWLITVVGSHMPISKEKKWVPALVIAIAFAAMQITWTGVNHLPSAQYSMHTYNK